MIFQFCFSLYLSFSPFLSQYGCKKIIIFCSGTIGAMLNISPVNPIARYGCWWRRSHWAKSNSRLIHTVKTHIDKRIQGMAKSVGSSKKNSLGYEQYPRGAESIINIKYCCLHGTTLLTPNKNCICIQKIFSFYFYIFGVCLRFEWIQSRKPIH